LALSVERSAGDAKRLARLANSHVLAQLLSGFHQFASSFWLVGEVPNISETFFWFIRIQRAPVAAAA
jgi:hypothetical protein